jgi:hypothetical protein
MPDLSMTVELRYAPWTKPLLAAVRGVTWVLMRCGVSLSDERAERLTDAVARVIAAGVRCRVGGR